MASKISLFDEARKKEEEKIQYRRNQNELRKERLLDARKRTIGVDIDALDAQVAEIRQNQKNNNDDDRLDQLRTLEINRLLAIAQEEERMMRKYQLSEIKKGWDIASKDKKERDRQEIINSNFDLSKCSISSAQVFGGEDLNRINRLKSQKDQMRRWIQEQCAEKSNNRDNECNENENYSLMLKAIDEIRDTADREEKQMKDYLKDTVNAQNNDLARQQKNRRDELIRSSKASQGNTLNMDPEDTMSAMDPATGRIVRKDMFKGFTPAQKKTFLQENEMIAQQKRDERQSELNKDADWVMQQSFVLRAMEQANYEDNMMKEAHKSNYLAELNRQMEEQRSRKDLSDKNKYGNIGSEFFASFGRDCR